MRHKLPLQYYDNPANIDRKSTNMEQRGQYDTKSANTENDAHSAHGNKRSELVNTTVVLNMLSNQSMR